MFRVSVEKVKVFMQQVWQHISISNTDELILDLIQIIYDCYSKKV